MRAASVAPGRACVELGDLGPLRFDMLRRGAVVAAAGPMAALRFDPRGWQGYVWTDVANDLHKVATIADYCRGRRPALDVRDVLREADRIVWGFRDLVVEAASYLRAFETIDARLLEKLGPQLGAGLLAERSALEALCR